MKGNILKDWGIVDFSNPEHLEKVSGAFQAFMQALDVIPELKAAYQAFTTKGDFPAEILTVLEKYHAVGDFDLGYEQIFDIKDFTGTTESGFEILDVSSSIVFEKLKTGEKVKIYKASGAKVAVSFDMYGGGMGLDKVWMDDGKYWNIEDTAIAFRNSAYKKRAEAYYQLIEALAATNDVTWQTPTPATLANTQDGYAASRDVNTIQKACDDILNRIKDKGYGVNANSPFFLLAPNVLRPRINKALTRLNQEFAGSSRAMTYNITPIYTLMLTDNTKYYVGIPKLKMKGGYRMNLTLFNMMNILAYIETITGFMRYGGAIGDTEQLVRCETA